MFRNTDYRNTEMQIIEIQITEVQKYKSQEYWNTSEKVTPQYKRSPIYSKDHLLLKSSTIIAKVTHNSKIHP